ncbi:hypothetical protein FJTKL_10817 [Diaporthe vaccinii]|uniref:Secreted protein n=1 Tax=Diaporthe vaccinii TaxID=105482 RepID=A0ABR4FBV0_9PEZI
MPSLCTIASLFALVKFVCEATPRSDYTNIADGFLSTPSRQRPRFRYWLPDASVDAKTVKADIKYAGAIGAGGVEFLPFYNYGGELGGPPIGVNWSTYGFDTPAHLELFTSALEAHKEAGLVIDFSLGPNQGQGIPAHPDDEGLQWDLVLTSLTIAQGGVSNETIPGWLSGELVTAVSAIVISRMNVSYNVTGVLGVTTVTYEDIVLQNGSLTDITSMISEDGRISLDAPEALPDGHEQELFFFYQKLSHNQNVHFASNSTATIWDNGSYVVDHFSSQGAQAVQAFWEDHLLTDNVKDLLREVGNYGWSYTFLSPDNFDLPQAYVENGVLAPEDAMFQALVVLGSQNLTQASLAQLRNFADDGLPIIVVGSAPGHYPTQNITDPGDQAFKDSLAELLSHVNVHHAAEGELSQKLDSLDLKPRVGVQTNGTWYTTWREDTSNGLSYAYTFGDTAPASGVVVAQSTGTPYFLDAWTGACEPVLNYQTNGSVTIIPLDLAGNQTKIIAFAQHPIERVLVPEFHVTELSSNVIGLSAEDKGIALHIAASSDPTYITLSTGEEVQHTSQAPDSFELKPWTLELEHWEAPANFSDASITDVKTNTTHQLTKLVSWNDIPGATNTSGVGYYHTNFTWPPDSATGFANNTSLGAYIRFPPVLDAITVYINGARLPPLDCARPVADVTPFLVSGSNEVVAVVPSTMWNYLRSILPDIRSAGREFSDLAALPKTDNGLVGVVTVVPFEPFRLNP